MIDKEAQTIQITLADYEELLELKFMYENVVPNTNDLSTEIFNIIKTRVKTNKYNGDIEERKYHDGEAVLQNIIALLKYTKPEMYKRIFECAKINTETDEKEENE